jgi:hypothetical protein
MTVMMVVKVMMMVVVVMVVRRFRRTLRRNVHGNEASARRTFAHDVARTAGFHHAARATVSASDGVFHFLAVFFSVLFYAANLHKKRDLQACSPKIFTFFVRKVRKQPLWSQGDIALFFYRSNRSGAPSASPSATPDD